MPEPRPSVVDVVCVLVADSERGTWHGKSAEGIASILVDLRDVLDNVDVGDLDVFLAWLGSGRI